MRCDGFAGDDATLIERGEQAPLRPDHLAGPLQADMRFEPVERGKIESPRDCGALRIVGDEVEAFAVADMVQPELAREPVGHAILPCSSSESGVASSR